MNVVIPALFRGEGWIGGSNYFLGLAEALRAHPDPAGTKVTILTNRPDAFGNDGEGVEVHAAPWLDANARADYFLNGAMSVLARYNAHLNAAAKSIGADLITHAPAGRWAPCPMLHWMPDFQHRCLPDYFSTYEFLRRDRNVNAAAETGHLLLSSHSAAADFRRFYPQHHRTVLHVLQFTPRLKHDAVPIREDVLRSKFSLGRGYFLLPNQFWRHKNHAVVIGALRQLPEDFVVVATGSLSDSRGNRHIEALLESVDRYGLRDRFRTLGVLPRAEVLSLMRYSTCIINPSFFEGWSTVVEEAKYLGKRLVLSDIAVHREQAPPDAVYFNPTDPYALAQAMKKVAREQQPEADEARAEPARSAFAQSAAGFAARYWEITRAVVS